MVEKVQNSRAKLIHVPRVQANSVLCTKCGKWMHGRCAKVMRVTSTLAAAFVCEGCVETKEIVEPVEEYYFMTTSIL